MRIEFEAEDHQLSHSLSQGNTNTVVHREWDQFDINKAVIVQLRKSIYEGGFRLEREGMRHSLTLMTSEENIQSLYSVRQQILVPACWKQEPALPPPQKTNGKRVSGEPRYLGYLRVSDIQFLRISSQNLLISKVLVMESSMRAYIGEGRVISVCRCHTPQTPESPSPPQYSHPLI